MNIFEKRSDLPFFTQESPQEGEKRGIVYARAEYYLQPNTIPTPVLTARPVRLYCITHKSQVLRYSSAHVVHVQRGPLICLAVWFFHYLIEFNFFFFCYLSGNPIHCDCSLEWLRLLLVKNVLHAVQDGAHIKCASPLRAGDKALISLSDNQLCGKSTVFPSYKV